MLDRLICEIHPQLDVVTPEEWRRLFPDLPDGPEMIRLIQRSGIDGFAFHSIVVREEGRPVLLLPLFETIYDMATFVDVEARPIVSAIGRWWPALGRPKVLGVGFVEGEWGQIGIEPFLDRSTLEAAWGLALKALDALAVGLRADFTAYVNFTPESGRMLPPHHLRQFTGLAGLPYGRVGVGYNRLDAYIATLSSNTRSSLRRKLRRSTEIRVHRTHDPGPWLDTIYEFYVATVQHSNVVFGVHRKAFFEQVCGTVPGAEYWLYFLRDRLLAFRLVVVTPGCLIDKYFGMDPVEGRRHDLYFVSWLENIRCCIERGIPRYHAGQSEEDTKARLGAQFVPSLILFRHRRRLLHQLLALLAKYLAYQPKVALPPARLGSDWDAPSTAKERQLAVGYRSSDRVAI